jgi:hypothetical protein
MENVRLQDDLLREFKQEKELITAQLDRLVPLGVALRKPVAARVFNKILLLSTEVFFYLAAASAIAFIVFRDRLYPFYTLSRLRLHPEQVGLSKTEVDALYWSVPAFAVLCSLCFLIIARCMNRIRRKNAILQIAGRDIKEIVGEHLKRKAAIETIDQRHFGILDPLPVNDPVTVVNPGY